MEKTTKKRKKSKRLKRRIGLIAVGGLSFVLTICLSVGATLAWFAGSTWASNDLYMGGPVYVEMAGRGMNGYDDDANGTTNEGGNYATWKGGAGTLDIAASARTTGTASGQNAANNILLPGQKLLIYSQARVYSTLQTSTVKDGAYDSESSGADNSNTSNGQYKYYDGQGRVQTTTTSVLRAKFSINIEFDPSVGFNNFTDQVYAQGYPVKSTIYKGEYGTTGTIGTPNSDTASFDKTADGTAQKASLNWVDALGATPYTITRTTTTTPGAEGAPATTTTTVTEAGRRDAVDNTALVEEADKDKTTGAYDYDKDLYANLNESVTPWVKGDGTLSGGAANDMWQVKYGLSKCVYGWKYVSKDVYTKTDAQFRVGAPFNGMYNTAGGPSASAVGEGGKPVAGGTGNGFYAIYENDGENLLESEAFYKARTAAYLDSYAEHYVDDYNRDLVLKIGSSLSTLEDALNQSFINLVGQSSDNIWAGNIMGFNAESDGRITYPAGAGTPAEGTGLDATRGIPASWLYVDPVIGNDTNSADSASSVGGWWYLVENVAANGNKSSGNNTIVTQIDNVVKLKTGGDKTKEEDYERTGATTADDKGIVTYNWGNKEAGITNNTTNIPADAQNRPKVGVNFQRAEDISESEKTAGTTGVAANDKQILTAKLYEITPNLRDKLIATAADGTKTTKVVSVAFPFVNGNFELPGQALTNVFANAKISFQITFQALQAFFPFSSSIDSIPSGTAITGTGKALNIGNAIPVYNEAFDYLSWLDTSSR